MTLPEKMTAIEIAAPGGPEALVPVERPVPRPGPGEVLVRVAAAGVNRPDVMQRQGNYPPPPGASDIPGLEIAGEVVEAGPGAAGLPDRVCALRPGGRLRGVLPRRRAALPRGPKRLEQRPGGGPPRDVLHGVDERLRTRAARGRREHPRARREQRHRDDRHPARAGVRGDGLRHRRLPREVPGVRRARRRRVHRLPAGRLRGPHHGRDRGARGRRGARHGGRGLLPALPQVPRDGRPARPDRHPARDQERDQPARDHGEAAHGHRLDPCARAASPRRPPSRTP